MRIALRIGQHDTTWCLDRVYHMGDLISEGCVNKGPSNANEGSSSFTKSVFDALMAQALSDLMRKKSVHCNLPPKGKHGAQVSSEPKSITASHSE